MALVFPNMYRCLPAFVESTRRHPFLHRDFDDFMKELQTIMNQCQREDTSCSNPQKSDEDKKATASDNTLKDSDAVKRPVTLFRVLLKNARKAMDEVKDDQSNSVNANQEEIQSTEKDSTPSIDGKRQASNSKSPERIIPINGSEIAEYEIKFNFEGCSPDSIKLVVADGIIKASAKMEEEGYTKNIIYERTLPSDVDVSSLKATFLADGTLKIVGKKSAVVASPEIHLEVSN